MQNIYYSSDISQLFISDFTSIIDLQFNEYKKQIIQIIIEEIINKDKLLKTKNNKDIYIYNDD